MGSLLFSLESIPYSNHHKYTSAVFSPSDELILSDGVLWDLRVPQRVVHKFDKLSSFGFGNFHPLRSEVIINSAVWDIRTFKLLRMLPSLDQSVTKFTNAGDIIYSFRPKLVLIPFSSCFWCRPSSFLGLNSVSGRLEERPFLLFLQFVYPFPGYSRVYILAYTGRG